LGYDYYLSDTFSMGATYTVSGRNVSSLNINYVPSGYTNNGWIFGIDLARIDGQSAGGSSFFLRKEKKSKNILFFSACYKFKPIEILEPAHAELALFPGKKVRPKIIAAFACKSS
jgi:hypothetical protein